MIYVVCIYLKKIHYVIIKRNEKFG